MSEKGPLTRSIFLPSTIILATACLISPVAVQAQAGGFAPEWEIRKTVATLAAECQRLKPLLEEVKPQEWVSKGAPQAYVPQWTTARSEVQYMATSTENLSREPEKLTFALDAFFRLQALESILASLGEGVKKYQNPALADLIRGVFSENSGNREKLRQYIIQLAAAKDLEFQVVNQEAQRCRGMLLRQPAQPPRAEKKAEQK